MVDASADLALRLTKALTDVGRVAVAFSGGVDSGVVAMAAERARPGAAVAITAAGPSLGEHELEAARRLAKRIGIRHVVIDAGELADANYVKNAGDRCFHCKNALYGRIAAMLPSLDATVICSGANLDDFGDFRPGLLAAAAHGVLHPLREAGFTKDDVRQLARYWELPNAEKPASPCLASRLAVGVEVSAERLRRVELAEDCLRSLGFSLARVRVHPGEHARIEVPLESLPNLLAAGAREVIAARLRELGFRFISVDIEGFRSGSLNVMVPAELRATTLERLARTS